MTERACIDVAVAVLQRADGHVLWCRRPSGKPYAGYWEFPGGKVEAGETVWQALVREIDEELGMGVHAGGPWLIVEHDYPHARVRLHFMRVWAFVGAPQAREGQAFEWAPLLGDSRLTPILPATLPLLPRLALPARMLLTQVELYGLTDFLERLATVLTRSAPADLPLVQFREKHLSVGDQVRAARAVEAVAADHHATVLINSDCAAALRSDSNIHYTQAAGLGLDAPTLAPNRIHTVAVHTAPGLAAAARRGFAAAVLGTVLTSHSHPGGATLGWQGFAALARQTRLPVYAIGGLTAADVSIAQSFGAHGVALRGAAWTA
ncbi:MAG: Nudix family hydrolase [Burkholderiaceae bacterium]|jgi:8-oxo-dGTP diphosphatase